MRGVICVALCLGLTLHAEACCCGTGNGLPDGPMTQDECAAKGGTYCGSCTPPCDSSCSGRAEAGKKINALQPAQNDAKAVADMANTALQSKQATNLVQAVPTCPNGCSMCAATFPLTDAMIDGTTEYPSVKDVEGSPFESLLIARVLDLDDLRKELVMRNPDAYADNGDAGVTDVTTLDLAAVRSALKQNRYTYRVGEWEKSDLIKNRVSSGCTACCSTGTCSSC